MEEKNKEGSQSNNENEAGIIQPIFSKFIDFFSMWSAEKLFIFPKGVRKKSKIDKSYNPEFTKRVDKAILLSLVIGMALYTLANLKIIKQSYEENWVSIGIKCILIFIVIFRILNMISWLLRPIFVKLRYQADKKVVSYERNLLLAFIHYFELVVYFAFIYSLFPKYINYNCLNTYFFTNLYFSAISQLTIGYGDITPMSFYRFFVVFQSCLGLLIIALTIGTLIPQLKFSKINESKNQDNNYKN